MVRILHTSWRRTGLQARFRFSREMPSFRIRKYTGDRLIPKRAAAPLGPATTHFVCSRILRMCSRCASRSVTCLPAAGFGSCFSAVKLGAISLRPLCDYGLGRIPLLRKPHV